MIPNCPFSFYSQKSFPVPVGEGASCGFGSPFHYFQVVSPKTSTLAGSGEKPAPLLSLSCSADSLLISQVSEYVG